MQVTNQAAAPTPVSAAKLPDNANRNGPFASLLRKSQTPQHKPTEAPQRDAEPAVAAAPSEPDTAAEPETQAAPNAPARARPKTIDKTAAPRPAEGSAKTRPPGEATSEAPKSDATERNATKRGSEPAAQPALDPWMAALQRPADATAGAAAADLIPADTPPGQKADDKLTVQDKAAHDTKARFEAAADTRGSALHQASVDAVSVLQAGQHAAAESRGPKPAAADIAPGAAALGAAAFNPLLGGPRESAPPLTVNLPTPLASPEFAQALGVQMSVLATDGVQRAELQLNPAEMGPVSVQIVIDGTSAQVDFGADLAATRHAIEAGLPELAGALRDAGFTLTGGGVSQHSRGRDDSQPSRGDAGGSRNGAGAAGAAVAAPLLRRTVMAGGVDLYA